ncbi:MAG: serine hydrolase domain-containing protein, partial [Gemmatimonadales bacterium]
VPATAETVYRIGSVTKQFTAAAIMRLMEQGKLSLDDTLQKFLPSFPTQGNRVTVRQLLNHTSGIKSYTSLGPKWARTMRIDLVPDSMVALFATEPFDIKPGDAWRYNNSGYFLLGVIAGKVTGTPYPALVEAALLAPLGLGSSSYCHNARLIPKRAQGYAVDQGVVINDHPISMNIPAGAGSLCSTVLDLLAWQRALDGGRVLDAKLLTAMRTGQVKSGARGQYGYGVAIGALQDHAQVAHSGGINGFSSWLANYPDDRLTVVVLTNNASGQAPALGAALARLVLGLPAPAPQ